MPKLRKFSGINNVALTPESARPGDFQTASNVYIGDSGEIVSRKATSKVYSGTIHSLNTDTGKPIFCEGTGLYEYDNGSISELSTGISAGIPMRYLYLNGKLYFSNGTDSGVYENGTVRSFGLDAPPKPTLADASGQLDPGTYSVVLSYVRSDGTESGTCAPQSCDCVSGGIAISGITASADADVEYVAVYVTGVGGECLPDGSGLKLAALLVNANGSHTLTGMESVQAGATCKTYLTQPMPAWTRAFFHYGRLYVVSGNEIWYSQPYQFECTRLDTNFLPLQATANMAIPLSGGVWIGTDTEFYFLAGKDPVADGGFVITNRQEFGVSECGVMIGSGMAGQRKLAPGKQAVFVCDDGVIVGDGAGMMVNITAGVWKPESSVGRVGCVYDTHGPSLYMFRVGSTVRVVNLKNGAVTKLNLGVSAAGVAGSTVYMIRTGGLYYFADLDEDLADGVTTPISTELTKEGVTFGSNLMKSITEAFAIMETSGSHTLTISSGGLTGSCTSVLPAVLTDAQVRGHKFKAPRGVRGRGFTLTLENNGNAFKLYELDMLVAQSQTRRGKQCSG